jgi:uncharacterized cupin superfamily protein
VLQLAVLCALPSLEAIPMTQKPVHAESVAVPTVKTIYPQPFAAQVEGRIKRKLGDVFGLTTFGVNLTQLLPGAVSALVHHHTKQDEFIYVLSGTPTLVVGDDRYVLNAGDCYGFRAGTGEGHQLANNSAEPVTYLEIGDRLPGDLAEYPHDDLKFTKLPDGKLVLTHKDGRPY